MAKVKGVFFAIESQTDQMLDASESKFRDMIKNYAAFIDLNMVEMVPP